MPTVYVKYRNYAQAYFNVSFIQFNPNDIQLGNYRGIYINLEDVELDEVLIFGMGDWGVWELLNTNQYNKVVLKL